MKHVLYMCVDDENYPRNRSIRSYLSDYGFDVHVQRKPKGRSLMHRSIRLVIQNVLCCKSYNYVFLAEQALQYALAAKITAMIKRCPLVIDAFVGMYETNVEDRKICSPSSTKARLFKVFDRLALRLADIVLIDTDVRASQISKYTNSKVLTMPVGFPQWARSDSSDTLNNKGSRKDVRVLYYGNYIPLHGLDYVVENLAHISNDKSFQFLFVGDGEERLKVEDKILALGLQGKIKISPPVEENQLRDYIDWADVVLGIFGTSPKAESVIANKVWQALAMGKIVISRKSKALEEIRDIVGHQLITIDVSAPFALKGALEEVQARPDSNNISYRSAARRLERYQLDRFASLLEALRE